MRRAACVRRGATSSGGSVVVLCGLRYCRCDGCSGSRGAFFCGTQRFGKGGRFEVLSFKGLEILFVVQAETKAGVGAGAGQLKRLSHFLPLLVGDDGVYAVSFGDLVIQYPQIEFLEAERGQTLNGLANAVAKGMELGVEAVALGDGLVRNVAREMRGGDSGGRRQILRD